MGNCFTSQPENLNSSDNEEHETTQNGDNNRTAATTSVNLPNLTNSSSTATGEHFGGRYPILDAITQEIAVVEADVAPREIINSGSCKDSSIENKSEDCNVHIAGVTDCGTSTDDDDNNDDQSDDGKRNIDAEYKLNENQRVRTIASEKTDENIEKVKDIKIRHTKILSITKIDDLGNISDSYEDDEIDNCTFNNFGESISLQLKQNQFSITFERQDACISSNSYGLEKASTSTRSTSETSISSGQDRIIKVTRWVQNVTGSDSDSELSFQSSVESGM